MFKVGDLVTPDREAIKELPSGDVIGGFVGGVYKVTHSDYDSFDLDGDYGRGWLPKYWKLAVTPETTFKLIKKHAK